MFTSVASISIFFSVKSEEAKNSKSGSRAKGTKEKKLKTWTTTNKAGEFGMGSCK